jgi:hypothetical protein
MPRQLARCGRGAAGPGNFTFGSPNISIWLTNTGGHIKKSLSTSIKQRKVYWGLQKDEGVTIELFGYGNLIDR